MTFYLPFYVGLFISLQIIMIGFKVTMAGSFTFVMSGFVVWIPSHILFCRVIYIATMVEKRTIREKRSILRGSANDDNELPDLPLDHIEKENDTDRLFAAKLFSLYIVVWVETLRELLTLYHASIWMTLVPLIFFIMLFAFEGLANDVVWWKTERQKTNEQLHELS